MSAPGPTEVSEREAEVLAALGAGLSNAQIAGRLHISVRTVEGHVSSLLRKYGVADRRELGALASTTTASVPAPGHVVGVPQSRTTFVGRAQDLDDVLAALASHQLVTLVGAGGVGKTRLAAAVAEAAASLFPFGGAFVDLVPVRDEFLPEAVAAALGVTERGQRPLVDAIVDRLSRGRSLLVLDNCEHLVDAAAAFVDRVLTACPSAVVLATSRERLGLPGERALPLAPLPLGSDAEALFEDRARAADPAFAPDPGVVADLCSRLDGMPLAIELAAARSASLGATGLLTGLGDYLRLLAGGRGPVVRHRSLRGVLDWSHELLSADEQAMFRRLAVFVGPFDLAAAASIATDGDAVAAADVLGRLVDKSLVTHRAGSWRLLETIRAYAGECLDASGERADIVRLHLAWATEAAASFTGPSSQWRDAFDLVATDLRAALASAPSGAHALARDLGRLTFARQFLMEALGHFREAAERAPDRRAAFQDLAAAAETAQLLNDSGLAFELQLAAASDAPDDNARALALARAVELACRYPATFREEIPLDRLRSLLASAKPSDDPMVAARIAVASAWAAGPAPLTPDAALAEVAVEAAKASGDPVLISAGLDAVRTAALTAGRARDAHRITTQRLTLLATMSSEDPTAAPEIEDTLALACSDAVAAGDLPAALSVARLILSDDPRAEHDYLTTSKVIPAYVLVGELDLALRLASSAWDGWQRAGRPLAFWLQTTVHFVALACGLRGDRAGVTLWRTRAAEVAGIPNVFQVRLSPLGAFVDARVAVELRDYTDAAALVARADAQLTQGRYLSYARSAAAELAVVASLPDAAALLAAARPAGEENDWAAACLTRAEGRLHDDRALLESSLAQWERLGATFEHACTLRLLA
ncbi:ATP-binding protein [Tenggerimyces flavus]|uniref:ATP-binding protein n=1 Tax=Tenggerimyces flavus TaxID=1708749 RepID=A0ABV7YFA5_9ACTN|nr:LuxR C-terminal-related transcriptional regulator [Tenggerimyces flavus]MBM7791368.1 putative ATPase/DNA-binding CsgD family transcriptional regulator [Tenggerimyces flavus]